MTGLGAAACNNYQRWNGAVHTALFKEPREHAPAYLYLEPDLLAKAAAEAGVTPAEGRPELVGAVRATLLNSDTDSPFQWHLRAARAWAEQEMEGVPPFLALLSVLVLGAEAMVTDAEHAAHNYYDRLIDLLEVDDNLAGRIRRCFKETAELWHHLNDWLVHWDGELGLPSAQITDRRVNIGFPLSQALVSAQDRLRLAEVFEDYGLRPGHRMAPLEMEQYLSHWLEHSAAPAKLRRLWSNDEARRRVTQIACAELEAWPGPSSLSAGPEEGPRRADRQVPLLWRADLTGGTRPAIDLFLACQSDPARVEGSYSIIAPTDEAGREGLEASNDALAIRGISGSELCGLEPWTELPLAALLAGAFTIERREQPASTISRSSNPVLVLAHDERDGLWHEVSRAQLLERCIVLAHQDVAAKVQAHLARYARAGYEQMGSTSLPGLPPGWTAFIDVVLADAPDDEARGVLAILSPMRANVIALEGGVRLGRQTWHADAPPTIVATLAAERWLGLAAERRRALSPAGPDHLDLGEHLGRVACPLAGCGLSSGDYVVALAAISGGGERRLDEAPMRLRTASDPRPLRSDPRPTQAHAISSPWGIVSATTDDGSGSAVSGALLLELEDDASDAGPLTIPRELPLAERWERDDAGEPTTSNRTYAMPCAVLGHHYWIVDAAEPGDDWRTLKHMRCRECQREEWTRNRGRRRRAAPKRRFQSRTIAEPPRARLPALKPHKCDRPALDLMLDALSYIGSGSWVALREIAQAIEPGQPWLAAEAARAFSALGHVDITLNPHSRQPSAWQVAPAALVETCDGSWVLAGSRSDRLVEAILSQDKVAPAREGGAAGLSVVRVRPNSEEDLLELVETLEAAGLQLALSERFSERLAPQLPLLAKMLLDADEFRLGAAQVETFDLPSRRWVPAKTEERGPGAYRTQLHGRLNGVITGLDGASVMRVTDAMTGKHIAAAQAKAPILAYDPASFVLSVPLGAELPGLLDRVATLCSGAPAFQQRDTWTTHYPAIPASVAQHIQRCLGL